MSEITEKWGRAVAERGFAQIPNYLLYLNQFLDREVRLSPVELLVLMQLVGTWWRKDDMPFPSMGTLAVRCGVSERQIQRSVNRLVEIGLIGRVNRRLRGIISSNAYDLMPLAAILTEIAKVFPNEFPRNVDRATVKEISGRVQGLLKGPETAKAEAPSGRSLPSPQAKRPLRKPLRRPARTLENK